MKKVKTFDQAIAETNHYNYRHQQLREQLLRNFPLCQICEKQFSCEAAHIVYPAESLKDYLALCKECHKDYDRNNS